MTIDGTYAFAYSGANGLGVGVFRIDNTGRFEGVDFVGGKYEGSARENKDGTIGLKIEFDVLPGMTLVQGTAPQDTPYRRSIDQNLPPEFGDGRPFELNSPPGIIWLIVKRVPDDFSAALTQNVVFKFGGPDIKR